LISLLGGNRGGLGLDLGKEKMTGTEFVISLLPFQKPQRARTTFRTAQNVHGAGVDQVLQILLHYTYISNLYVGEGETNPNLRTTNHPYINFPYPSSSI
jgi:hypothetical protein